MPNKVGGFPFPLSALIVATIGVSACGDGGIGGDITALCQELQAELISAVPKDGILSLTDPPLVAVGDAATDYLLSTDRVIGLEGAGEYIAIPHNIL